jgi:BTB/POZ domain-containing protein KCTD9
LLYRGSEQDFTHANFVKLVGGQGPTLHIIKSEHDNLFGGCAFEKYPTGDYKQDDKAFLFQLHPNQVMLKNTLHASYKDRAIRCWSNSLSMFGAGVDLYICETKSVPQGYNQE